MKKRLREGCQSLARWELWSRLPNRGLLDFAVMLADLKVHNFFISPALEDDFLARDAQRKSKADS